MVDNNHCMKSTLDLLCICGHTHLDGSFANFDQPTLNGCFRVNPFGKYTCICSKYQPDNLSIIEQAYENKRS